MDSNQMILVTMVVLMFCGTGYGILQENCLKHITISNGEFSGLIKNCSANEPTKTKCSFVFDVNANNETIRHGQKDYSIKDLGFWLKKENNKTFVQVKNKNKLKEFNFTFYGEGQGEKTSFNISNCRNAADDNQCTKQDSFGYRIYVINNIPQCKKCGDPITPLEPINTADIFPEDNTTYESAVEPTKAAEMMKQLTSLAKIMGNKTSGSVSIGPIVGVMVKPENEYDLKKLSFVSTDTKLNLIEDQTVLKKYPMSVSISEEAYKKSYQQQKEKTFVGVFRFPNMTLGENSTALTGQVYAIEMGTNISNLSEPIQLNYNLEPPTGFNLSCQSWDGEGSSNWTDEGCLTKINDTVTCECTHLTFFAVLMTPSPEPIADSDMKSLTYLTYIGCGLSLFFLGIGLFMFCCIRKAQASNAIHILMHLFLALFLLNLTFLTNEWVANLQNVTACKVMAGFMHYSMLCSFTWFAVEAFHLCLQLTTFSTVSIPHYKIKLSLVGWIPGAIVVTIVFILGKYGELKIYTDIGTPAKMCWILDPSIHYGVNIGYYAIVFLFTFTIFVVMLRWLCYLRSAELKAGGDKQGSTRSRDIVTIMGLCCILGITWSFAFFAQGPLRLPSYYIFTILNSLQGFFLFVYYCNTSNIVGDTQINSDSSSSTKTSVSKISMENPYHNS